MKKNLIVLSVLIFLFAQLPVAAQAPDTVLVPSKDYPNPGDFKDVLTKFIAGDTTATGQRKNINRVYKLKRGDFYFQTGQFLAPKVPLTIIADKDDGTPPPVIAPWPLADGSIPRITITFYHNTYLKNLYFQGISPTELRNAGDRPLVLMGDGKKLTIENCIVEGFRNAGLFNGGANNSFFIKDCIWRNNKATGAFFGQFFFNTGTGNIPLDTLYIVNNTFFNGNSYFMCTNRQYTKYVRFEHNTLFVNHANPFYSPYLSNADIKNNIFFLPATVGETNAERIGGYYDWDKERLAVFSIDTIPTDMANTYGITDQNRRINLTNNAYFWTTALKDYWAANDTVDGPMWLNNRTMAFFNNKAKYPNLIEKNNVEVDPQFNNDVMVLADSNLAFVKLFRAKGSGRLYYYNPSGGPIFPSRWPIPENLAYSNAALQRAGDDGFALGDLNWFPAQKKEWLKLVSVKDNNHGIIPSNFSLSNAYPNPFNPETKIEFNIAMASNVRLAIYNILGQLVKVLTDGHLNPGSYSTVWNGTDNLGSKVSSGIYLYKLQATPIGEQSGSFSAVKKLVLIK
jgi:hypothetical protein